MLIGGLVVKTTRFARTLLRSHGCRIWVHWAARELPDKVRYGEEIWAIGHLRSYNVGTAYSIVHACLLNVSPQRMMQAALDAHPDAVVLPEFGKGGDEDAAERVDVGGM